MFENEFWLLAPDGGGSGAADGGGGSASGGGGDTSGGAGGVVAPSAPAAPGGVTSAPSTGVSGAGAAGPGGGTFGGGSAQTVPVQPAAPAMESIRDVVQRLGRTDLANQFQDDTALLNHLLLAQQQGQQAQQLARYGEQVVGQWDKVQAFLQQQAAQQQAAQGDPWYKPYFSPPEFNPAWEGMILRDAQGNLHAKPGAPPDVVQKYAQYQQYQRQQIEKMTSNPFEYFAPAIKQLAREEAQKIASEQLSTHNDRQSANQFIQQHANWLYASDPTTGQQARDPGTGVPLLSQWGVAFRDHVAAAEKAGIKDQRLLQEYGLRGVQFDYMAQQLAAQQAGAQAQAQQPGVAPQQPISPAAQARNQANQQFLNGAGGQRAPGVGPQGQQGNPPANQQGRSLNEMLRAAMKTNGITDEQILASR